MSNYPISLDDDVTLPPVNNNITEIGDEAINACREAIFNIETELGLGLSGSAGTLADRIGMSIGADGYIKSSALTSLGLVTLPITNSQIANNAGIPESKLALDHRTADLFNYTRDLASDINTAISWISLTGIKLEPHILGITYKHPLSGISVSENAIDYFLSRYRTFRDNTDSYTALNELNSEVINHQWSDGSGTSSSTITTNDGSTYPADYAHTSSGIYLDTTRFSVIPQTVNDLQLFAQHIDDASIFLYGTRIQNLYSNGISRASRSAVLTAAAQGRTIVPSTQVITHLRNNGSSSYPVDDIETGDDVIEFTPNSSVTSNFLFDSQFALAQIGDIIRVNYGSVEVPFLIKEKKYIPGTPSRFLVRISSNNLYYKTDGYAKIEKPLYHENKYGVLAVATANNEDSSLPSSLIVTNPTGAMALGVGFNADLIDSSHYLLYLALYPTGNPDDGYTVLPGIDVTGNLGVTPGKYTLDTVVQTVNDTFRKAGYNYRFVAFSYQGEFGISLADPYSNAAFSILDGVVDSLGDYDQTETEKEYIYNVIGLFGSGTLEAVDPLGLGPLNGGVSSPAYITSFASSAASLYPTKLYVPLDRNNFYVNGTERDKLTLESGQTQDGYGFGYWDGYIVGRVETPAPNGKVSTTYRIFDNVLSSVNIRPGSTIVVQPISASTSYVDYGRFIVSGVTFTECGVDCYTDITVYDAIHGTSSSPYPSASSGHFRIYFNSGSVSVNEENVSDYTSASPFKRYLEIYIDDDAKTFTHERGRFTNGGSNIFVNSITLRTTSELSKMELISISPKLRGYQFSSVNKISLFIDNLSTSTGIIDGYLASYDGTNLTHIGPTTTGRLGQVLRFYDETNIDYIDVLFPVDSLFSDISDEIVDIQLFPSLDSDKEILKLASCQYNTVTNNINHLTDLRQFGNVSEDELSTSALDYISLPDKLLHQNGVFKGFDAQDVTPLTNPNGGQIYLSGGTALVGGKIVYMNNETVVIPFIQESYSSTLYGINWVLCVNDVGEYITMPLLDYNAYFGSNVPFPNRNFLAKNPNTGNTYYLEAIYFSDLVNNRKDLTPLYLVNSDISGSTISLTIHDLRKFVRDVEADNTLVYNYGTSQGSFKNAESIFNWLTLNNPYSIDVVLNGLTETISKSVIKGINDLGTWVIDGKNNASLTFSNSVTIGSDITFKNMTLTFESYITLTLASENVVFDNCVINFNADQDVVDLAAGNIVSTLSSSGVKNVTFKDCTITADYSAVTAFSGGSVFYLSSVENFNFIDSTLDVTFNVTPGTHIPGWVFYTNSQCTNFTIKGSTISGNFRSCFTSSSSSCDNLKIQDCEITSSYSPGAEYASYDTSNLINSGNGFIYLNLDGSTSDTTTSNIYIDNVTFNFSPTSVNNDRFSFINFELDYGTKINNLNITNCKFNNTIVTASTDDFRAAIAVIGTYDGTTLRDFPLISGMTISGNICNRNQLIAVTGSSFTEVTNTNDMSLTGLMTQNCIIENNTCGAVGYWVGVGDRNDNIAPNITTDNNKELGLSIIGNYCNAILNIDQTGKEYSIAQYSSVTLSYITTCYYPSSHVNIDNNKTGWINVGVCKEEESSLFITNNSVTGVSDTYLTPYYSNSAFTDKTKYAIHVDGCIYKPTDTNIPKVNTSTGCIISNNVIGAGVYDISGGTPIIYSHDYGAIWVRTSSIITNNRYKKVYSTYLNNNPSEKPTVSLSSYLIKLSNADNFVVTGNILERTNVDILGYVAFEFLTGYSTYPGENVKGIITENVFDSPYVQSTFDVTIDLEVNGTMSESAKWIVEKNINQTVTTYLTIFSATNYLYTSFFLPLPTKNFSLPDSYLTVVSVPTISYDALLYDGYQARAYGYVYDLSQILPKGVKIININYRIDSTAFAGIPTKYQTQWSLYSSTQSETDIVDLPNATTTTFIDLNDGVDFNNFINNRIGSNQNKLIFSHELRFDHTEDIATNIYYTTLKYRW